MARPRDPMLEEFRIINESQIDSPESLDRLATAICELFTEDCLLEDTSTTDVVNGRAELYEYCKGLFGPYSRVKIEPQEIIDSDTTSVMVLKISGDHTGELYGHPPTGKRVWFPAVAIYRCNSDCTQVRHETLAYDTGFIIEQVRPAARKS